jgi:ferredoxin/flavodoxin---NADP+ reductase
MALITKKQVLGPQIFQMEVHAPLVAARQKAGQFIMVRVHEKGERIPLTIVDSDPGAGTVTLVFQVVGKTTRMLSELAEGDEIMDVAGPLGRPTEIERFGTVAVVGGGVGIAVAYPVARAMSRVGNSVISILGARTRDLLIFEREISAVSEKVFVTTDDGSYARKGFVTEPLKEVIESFPVRRVVAVGPVQMMDAVSRLTKAYGVATVVSLNPIMVDGTGMCGACRVTVGNKVKFACVEGPDFDGHQVDFRDLAMRLSAYVGLERESLRRHLAQEHVPTAP